MRKARSRNADSSATIGSDGMPRARRRADIDRFPEPHWREWKEPSTFREALDLHMRRHGDGPGQLRNAIVSPGDTLNWYTIRSWRRGQREPQSAASYELLARIEARYRLPAGYFRSKLSHSLRATTGLKVRGVSSAERRRLVWHLPDDFDRRVDTEQREIVDWVRRVIVSGSTDYRRYQALAIKDRYALRFGEFVPTKIADEENSPFAAGDPELAAINDAPLALKKEMAELVRFKTTTLTAVGYQRNGVWGAETAAQKIEHLGLLFGALAAPTSGRVKGLAVPPARLSFSLLVFPSIWDWYVQWRERRRGFYTSWEVDMLRLAVALTRDQFGWIRQSPELGNRISAIDGLVSSEDVAKMRADWSGACERMHRHALARAKEIERVARVHRDPFEPILPILEAQSPLHEYRAITEEIIRRKPNERCYPKCAAEAVRSFLMLRLGLHLGVRQKNLRQLLVKTRGQAPTSERTLEAERRGELRWNEREAGWEVLIPPTAFKNAKSSYFSQRPFRLMLPDLGRLYEFIDSYLGRHRAALLDQAADPGTFFVKTMKRTSKNAAYDQTTFYEAWRLVIQRYGIFNPYTGRGVVKGLLPHGPHSVRDVLATHILKKTGSYEQASYAIQDTPETVANHYGRFLPQDKAALAAKVLNQV